MALPIFFFYQKMHDRILGNYQERAENKFMRFKGTILESNTNQSVMFDSTFHVMVMVTRVGLPSYFER